MYIHTSTDTHAHARAHTYIHTLSHNCMYTHIHNHTRIRTYAHTNTYMHTYRTVRQRLADGAILLDKFIITKQLTKRLEEYPDARAQPHVQVHARASV